MDLVNGGYIESLRNLYRKCRFTEVNFSNCIFVSMFSQIDLNVGPPLMDKE